jgi:carbon storage regulator CsrA
MDVPNVSGQRRIEMLVLSRKPGEKVFIDKAIALTVVEIKGNRVRLAFHAPDHIRILRAELTRGCMNRRAATHLNSESVIVTH